MKRVLETSENLLQKGAQSSYSIPYFELVVVYALNFGDRYSEIINIANIIKEKYDQNNFKTSWQYQIFLAFYARALLNTGKVEEGIEIFNNVEFKDIPVNLKYYLTMRYNLVKVEFLVNAGKLKKALVLIDDIKTISHMLKFKYFYDKAIIIESEIYNQVKSSKPKQHNEIANTSAT